MALADDTVTTLGQSLAPNQSVAGSWQQLLFDLSSYTSLSNVRYIAHPAPRREARGGAPGR